jgi:hypothetical protein
MIAGFSTAWLTLVYCLSESALKKAEHQFPLSAFPLDQEEEDENQEWHQSLPKSPSCEKA